MPVPAAPPFQPELPRDRLVLGYAGFWWRVLAFALDSIILNVAIGLLARMTGLRHLSLSPGSFWRFDPFHPGPDASVATVAFLPLHPVATLQAYPVPSFTFDGGALDLLGLVLTAAYFTLFESSRWRGTPGKRACRLSVTDLSGNRIGPGRALARYLAKFLSALLLCIGFLMVAWTRRKQGLHDLVAGTLVLRPRPAETVFAFQAPPA